MKKFFLNILSYLFIAAVVLVPLAVLFQDCYDIFLKLGGGSVIIGVIVTLLAVIGGCNVVRGFFAVLVMDENKYGRKTKKNWKFVIYLIFYIGGYLALYYAIIRCL